MDICHRPAAFPVGAKRQEARKRRKVYDRKKGKMELVKGAMGP